MVFRDYAIRAFLNWLKYNLVFLLLADDTAREVGPRVAIELGTVQAKYQDKLWSGFEKGPITITMALSNVTIGGETVLHLAVMNYLFEAFEIMFEKLKQLDRETLLNSKDEQGNMVLHLAAYMKQREASTVGAILENFDA
ncbi:hypothetical protein Syun_018678 [Stephania yunnanensis]|uniref:Uncharacterized protein n=1 Tax=Stephania yunnanensis TaxID=152371 RepID=A0AAP0NYM2_9MAGN